MTAFLLGVGALLGLVLLIYVLRHRHDAPIVRPPQDPMAAAPEPVLDALAPGPPAVTAEPAPEGETGEPLAAIPADSTEWMEGEDVEVEGAAPARLRPVSVLLDALHSGDAIVCAEAVEELVRHGAAAIPALEGGLNDPDPDVRVDVAKALATIRANEA